MDGHDTITHENNQSKNSVHHQRMEHNTIPDIQF